MTGDDELRDPDWYLDAVIYELHVRAFADSNGDGIGDFPGLTSKLDYLAELGITALWLLPFYPSPLRDDGYDISDYRGVHPAYGTLSDVRTFLREAHRRGLRVITELVLNHTSDQHVWFQRARRAAPGSRWRDWYVWSDTPQRYLDARVIFSDFETSNWAWDDVAQAYYWHRFYSQQPDLNFANPEVRREATRILDFWLDMGVDGLRLDAIPYLFEAEGTNCENLPQTHEFLKTLRAHIDTKYEGRFLLAEANQWPEDAAAYFGDGDECNMCFHFPLMPRLFMALQMEERYPVVDILQQTPLLPDGSQWALFLRNHDELTLEMVTDEERDYMYRFYARDHQARINLGIRRRLAPLLGHDRARIELLNILLLSLPGTPVLYYGDELGMGDNVYLGDRNGVRTPMQWSADRNAGFSTANPQQLYLPPIIDPLAHYENVNVETQLQNPSSLLRWTQRVLALRHRHQVFGRGDLEVLQLDNPHVLAYLRCHEDQVVLVVANLSRHAQFVELDLSRYQGVTPVELFGHTSFASISDQPYVLTLGPHGYYWLAIESTYAEPVLVPTVQLGGRAFADVFGERFEDELAGAIARYLPAQRWYQGKDRRLREVQVVDTVPLEVAGVDAAAIVVAEAHFSAGEAERYAMPLVVTPDTGSTEYDRASPGAPVARLSRRGADGVLRDGMALPETVVALYRLLRRRRPLATLDGGRLHPVATPALRRLAPAEPVTVALGRAEQSNSSAVLGSRLIVKLFRRLPSGINPEQEIGELLTNRGFPAAPRLAAALELHAGGERSTLLAAHELVPNEGDAWSRSLDDLGRRLEAAAASVTAGAPPAPAPLPSNEDLVRISRDEPPTADDEMAAVAERIGCRLGELHRMLGDASNGRAFAPEPVTKLYQRSIQQSMRNRVHQTYAVLGQRRAQLGDAQPLADLVLANRPAVVDAILRITQIPITGQRIRIHGDLHLGQVLWTGKDAVIIDFEGEPLRPVGERRIKRSPFRDVAGMLRSFEYATHVARAELAARGVMTEDEAVLDALTSAWYTTAAHAFLHGYLETVETAPFVAGDDKEIVAALDTYGLEKALYEVDYELRSRPEWAGVPLRGVLRLAGIDPVAAR
jgi:maltose alpha-D-glucosyltransferase/alpha-amylase